MNCNVPGLISCSKTNSYLFASINYILIFIFPKVNFKTCFLEGFNCPLEDSAARSYFFEVLNNLPLWFFHLALQNFLEAFNILQFCIPATSGIYSIRSMPPPQYSDWKNLVIKFTGFLCFLMIPKIYETQQVDLNLPINSWIPLA